MPAPRDYYIGLPVKVTVSDDGTVEYTVDLSEASRAPRETMNNPILGDDGKPVDQDPAQVDADTEAINASQAVTGSHIRVSR